MTEARVAMKTDVSRCPGRDGLRKPATFQARCSSGTHAASWHDDGDPGNDGLSKTASGPWYSSASEAASRNDDGDAAMVG